MATLREQLLRNNSIVPTETAEGMGQLRRGLRGALIDAERNIALADESSARATGDLEAAGTLRRRAEILESRQATAPLRVGRVEDVGGVGDAIDYAAGQIGSGLGSMAAPVAAGVTAAGVGSLLQAVPNPLARAAGRGIRNIGSFAAPAAISAEQMKGEFYGQAREDEALMARNTPEEINRMANVAGAAGGALDAVVPGVVARSLTGSGIRAGLARRGAGQRILGQTALEGATETGQGEIGRTLRGVLNPEQDVTGFGSERLNEFVGGAIGSSPLVTAGVAADDGFRRLGTAAEDGVRRTGEVIDLASGAVTEGVKRGREKVIDLRETLKERSANARSTWEARQEEMDLLNLSPQGIDTNDPAAMQAWFMEAGPRRTALVNERLNAMGDDPEAQRILARINDPATADAAIDEGAGYVMSKARMDNTVRAAARFVGEKAAPLGGKARAAGRAAASMGKAAWEGFSEGRKLSRQGAEPEDTPPVAAYLQAQVQTRRGVLRNNTRAVAQLLGRLGTELESMTRAGVKADDNAMLHLDHMAQHLAGTFDKGAVQVAQELQRMLPGDLTTALMDRVNNALSPTNDTLALRRAAADRLLAALPPETEKRLLRQGINLRSDEGKRQLLGMVEALAMGRVPPAARAELARIVGDDAVTDMIQAISPAPEATQDEGGADARNTGLTLDAEGNVVDAAESMEDGSEEGSDYEQRQGEKKLERHGGVKYFGFGSRPRPVNSKTSRDPFAYTDRAARRRPELLRADQTLSSGENALESKVASMQRYLEGQNVDVSPRTASEVLDSLGAQPTKRLQLFVDYMAQEGRDTEGKAGEKMLKLSQLGLNFLKDILEGRASDEALRNPMSTAKRREARQNGARILPPSADLPALGSRTLTKGPNRASEDDRNLVGEAMQRYFDNRYVVVGESLGDVDSERIERADFDKMIKTGKLVMAQRVAKKDKAAHAHRNNILTFQDVQGEEVPIKADDLVRWALTARRANEMDAATGTRQWMQDLMTGISALIESGLVTGMPTRLDPAGNVESFADGIPKNLILPSGKLYGEVLSARRRNPRSVVSEGSVEEDQAQDFFTPDDVASPEEQQSGFSAQEARESRVATGGQKDVRSIDTKKRLREQDEFEGVRIRTREQGMEAANLPRNARAPARAPAPAPAPAAAPAPSQLDLGTPRKFLDSLRKLHDEAVEGGDDQGARFASLTGRLNVRAVGGMDAARARVAAIKQLDAAYDKFTSRAEGSPFTEKQDNMAQYLLRRLRQSHAYVWEERAQEVAATPGKSSAVPAGAVWVSEGRRLNAQNAGGFGYSKEEIYARGKAAFGRQAWDDKATTFTISKDGTSLAARTNTGWLIAAEHIRGVKPERGPEGVNGPLYVSRGKSVYETKVYDENGTLVYRSQGPITGYTNVPLQEAFAKKASDTSIDNLLEPNREAFLSLKMAGDTLDKISKTATWTDGGRKLNAQATQVHNDLKRGGFAATHDSPHRFDGRFDWRKNKRRGEGAMVFGAGTYLSTGDSVHKYYKKGFTEKLAQKGDTEITVSFDGHEVSVVWDEDSQEWESAGHSNAAQGLVAYFIAVGDSPAEAVQRAIDSAFGIVDRSAEDFATHLDVIEYTDAMRANGVTPQRANSLAARMTHREKLTPGDVKGFEWLVNRERWNRMLDAAEARAKDSRLIDPSAITVNANKGPLFGDGASPTYQVSVQILPAQLLKWHLPLDKQSGLVRRVLNKAITELGLENKVTRQADIKGNIVEHITPLAELKGDGFYRLISSKLGGDDKASDWLQANGVLGHEYPASSGRDTTTPNYVIYDDTKISTNYVHFNQQSVAGKRSTPEEQQAAKDYIAKVLGPQVKTVFKDITGYSGEWIDAANTVEISTTAGPGAMQVAYHEALHAFFSKFVKNDPDAFEVLKELAEDPRVLRQLERQLAGDSAALAQLRDGEERLAYAYQFWAAGLIDLPYGKPRTLMGKVRKFFRQVFGMVSNLERAAVIFDALHAGKFSDPVAGAQAMQQALQTGMRTAKTLRKMDAVVQKAAALVLPAESIMTNSKSATVREIGKLFYNNPGDVDSDGAPGYINARDQMARRYINEFSHIVEGMDDKDYKAINDFMAQGTDESAIAYAPHRKAVKDLRALLRRFREYMVDERGVNMGDLGEKYYPRVWSLDKLMTNTADFLQMVQQKYPGRDGVATMNALTQNLYGDAKYGRPTRQDGALAPLNAASEERVLAWMKPEDAAPFLEDNLVGIMTRYFHEGARMAEYTKRFGQYGEQLNAMFEQADKELHEESRKMMRQGLFDNEQDADKWHARQMRDVMEATGAMEGSLGSDIGATWRSVNSWTIVYQNIRLLPLSLFASFVDPMGMIVRGAEFSEAFESFKRGVIEVGRQWKDLFKGEPTQRQADQWERLAQYVGVVDAGNFEAQLADMYSSVYMNPRAKAINQTFFKLNGMEAWNRGMRVGATKAAVKFIERHSKLPSKDSQRWLDELGLQAGDINLTPDGDLMVSVQEIMAAKGVNKQEARLIAGRVHNAINRWVTGAVLTPNAAQRPAWSSDPHYSMFFHLKQFTYSFHQTILKRAVNEGMHGNIAPLGSLFWYIPIMIGSDIMKGMIQGGGELPAHMKGMDAAEWVLYGAERGGIMGLGTLGMDAQQDLASIGGPAVEQVIDAFSDPLDRTAIRALPANPIYAEALR